MPNNFVAAADVVVAAAADIVGVYVVVAALGAPLCSGQLAL